MRGSFLVQVSGKAFGILAVPQLHRFRDFNSPLLYFVHKMSFRSNSWGQIPRRISRRFTTLEGWREIGSGIYAAAPSSRIRLIQNQFDSEVYDDDRTTWTRPSKSDTLSIRSRDTWTQDGINPFGDSKETGPAVEEARRSVTQEKPYHVFTHQRKWSVVVMIGVAGLFSGLSSNIYFPSLDAIARVTSRTLYIMQGVC